MAKDNDNSTPISRLREFVEWTIRQGFCSALYDFEKQCGLSNRYISNSTANGKGSISSDILGRIARRYPMLNLVWICNGEGDMLNDGSDGYVKLYHDAIEEAKLRYRINTDYKQAYQGAMIQVEALNRIINTIRTI